MVLFALIRRPVYHKNGTQFIGKFFNKILGEDRYDWIRVNKRVWYAYFWYTKQSILLKFNIQYPHIAFWFSILNKTDTSDGFPAKRQYERYQDFAVFNINGEGWFQLYFITASILVILWNWWIVAYYYDIRGHSPEDDDLYRYKDSRMTTNFDRTKYNFDTYFFGTHYYAAVRQHKALRDHPDDPRMNWRPQFRSAPYGLDRYIKYYGHSQNMRIF